MAEMLAIYAILRAPADAGIGKRRVYASLSKSTGRDIPQNNAPPMPDSRTVCCMMREGLSPDQNLRIRPAKLPPPR